MDNLQTLLLESAELLLIGMGTVFIILIMLIFLITIVSRILPEETLEEPNYARGSSTPAASNVNKQKDNQELIAVISSAVSAFRKRNSSN